MQIKTTNKSICDIFMIVKFIAEHHVFNMTMACLYSMYNKNCGAALFHHAKSSATCFLTPARGPQPRTAIYRTW